MKRYVNKCLVPLILALCLLPGCGDDDSGQDKQTIRGLQEENSVLREKISFLVRRLSAAQGELAEKSLRLTAKTREAEALDGLIKSDPKIQAMAAVNFRYERMLYLLLILILAVTALWGWRQYRETLSRYNQYALERVDAYVASRETGFL
jgi:hypothetical protein